MPGSKPDRDSMDREVFGMNGVPEGAEPGRPYGDKGALADAEKGDERRAQGAARAVSCCSA